MRERIITALALVAGLLAMIFLMPRPMAVVALALLVLGGAWEWAGFLGAVAAGRRIAYVTLTAALMSLLWWLAADPRAYSVLLWASAAWWLLALAWITRFPTGIPWSVTVACGPIVLIPAWVALGHLHFGTAGPQWLLFVFLLVWAADIGAFVVGRAFGRVKLAPRVSPGKTWEGVLGGLGAVLAVAVGGAWWFGLPYLGFVPLCLGVALVSVVGDLTVSMFKRHAGLKDSSQLLPGHGGILDRIDSLAAAAPVFVLALGWLGVGD